MSRIKSMLLTGVPASGALGGGASFVPFSDSFDTDGAMAAPWLNAGWAVSSGAAVAAVTLGSELLTNGDFSAWTADNPDGWTVSGESLPNREISEVGPGETHGGTGAGAANFYSDAIFNPSISQNIVSLSGFYRVTLIIDGYSNGSLEMTFDTPVGGVLTSSATVTLFNVGNKSFGIKCRNVSNDLTVSSASIKKTNIQSSLQLIDASAANVTATVKATIATSTQAGVALCWDSDTSPENGVIGFYDRTNNHAKLFKVVAGTWTSVIDAAATYSAGAVIKVVQTGDTTFQLWYNGSQIGTDVTISDAGIISNTLHGIFSTYTNSFDDFALEAS